MPNLNLKQEAILSTLAFPFQERVELQPGQRGDEAAVDDALDHGGRARRVRPRDGRQEPGRRRVGPLRLPLPAVRHHGE